MAHERRQSRSHESVDWHNRAQFVAIVELPDALRLAANERLLTVGLRTAPAQIALVNADDSEKCPAVRARP